ncbi:MAG TPA: NUDIX domain-containing protein [Candidatus Dormibacteraeota bacterium]|nr:NUDIX domain-containing protein [Candidatus Dormibacteraeota bacterium]
MHQRHAARILLGDDGGRVLLLRAGDPARPEAGSWWFTPGGGVRDGESTAMAARREVPEETGLQVEEMGAVVLRRHFEHQLPGAQILQDEDNFLVRCASSTLDEAEWTEAERQLLEEDRWRTRAELRQTRDTVYPESLAAVVDGLDEHRSRSRQTVSTPGPPPRGEESGRR